MRLTILRAETKADVAFPPGVGYGIAIAPGPVTAAQLWQPIPHDEKVVTMRLLGPRRIGILEHARRMAGCESGAQSACSLLTEVGAAGAGKGEKVAAFGPAEPEGTMAGFGAGDADRNYRATVPRSMSSSLAIRRCDHAGTFAFAGNKASGLVKAMMCQHQAPWQFPLLTRV